MTAVRAIVVIGLSLFFLVVVGPPTFHNDPWPYSGVRYESAVIFQHAVTIGVDRNSPAYRAGLRSGDSIGCLSPIDYEMLFPAFSHAAFVDGHRIELCVQRPGESWQNLTLAPKRMPPSGFQYGSPLGGALRICVYALFLLVGCTLVILRPSLMTWLLFGYCLAACPTLASVATLVVLPAPLYALLALPTNLWSILGTPLLALFALVVPAEAPPPGWRRALFWITLFLTLLVIAYVLAWPAYSLVGLGESPLDAAFTILTVAIVVARLLTMERRERARFGWAAFAIIFGVAANALRSDVPYNTVSVAGGFLTVVMPLCLLYAILRRHLIDVRFVLSRTVVFGAVTTLVVVVIGVVDWATSAYLSEVRVALAVDAAVTIALGVALHRSYGWIESAVDALLFRRKHQAEAYLRRAARTLLRADTEGTIDAVLVEDPYESLDLTMAALFRASGDGYVVATTMGWENAQGLSFAPGHDLVRFLATERERLAIGDLRKHVSAQFVEAGAIPAVAIPIFCDDDLFGFTLYGLHRDGTQLDPDELAALEHLCEMAAQAYTVVELRRYRTRRATTIPAEAL